jgi:DNA-binding MarR family transcriptional regulator
VQRDGFVRPTRDAPDLRQVRVALTASGLRLIETPFKAHNERERQWRSIFSKKERKLLVGIRQQVDENSEESRRLLLLEQQAVPCQ